MEVLTLKDVTFDPEAIINRMMKREKRSSRRPHDGIEAAAEAAYREGRELVEMKCALEILDVADVDAESITLVSPDGDARLAVGRLSRHLAPAHKAAVSVTTAGAPIVARVSEIEEEGDILTAYCLDTFGALAVADMSDRMRARVAEIARADNWGVGPNLQPGSLEGWAMEGQRDIWRLARGGEIGLSVTKYSVLEPRLSNSNMIGMGPHYGSDNVGSLCGECPKRDFCEARR